MATCNHILEYFDLYKDNVCMLCGKTERLINSKMKENKDKRIKEEAMQRMRDRMVPVLDNAINILEKKIEEGNESKTDWKGVFGY